MTKTVNFAVASLLFGICSFSLICVFALVARIFFAEVPGSIERRAAANLSQSMGDVSQTAARTVVEPLPVV